jgi:hypothetical protein
MRWNVITRMDYGPARNLVLEFRLRAQAELKHKSWRITDLSTATTVEKRVLRESSSCRIEQSRATSTSFVYTQLWGGRGEGRGSLGEGERSRQTERRDPHPVDNLSLWLQSLDCSLQTELARGRGRVMDDKLLTSITVGHRARNYVMNSSITRIWRRTLSTIQRAASERWRGRPYATLWASYGKLDYILNFDLTK